MQNRVWRWFPGLLAVKISLLPVLHKNHAAAVSARNLRRAARRVRLHGLLQVVSLLPGADCAWIIQIAHDRVEVDLLAGGQRGVANLSINKQGLVPTLQIDGQVLTQSLAILECLEQKRGPLLLPRDPLARPDL